MLKHYSTIMLEEIEMNSPLHTNEQPEQQQEEKRPWTVPTLKKMDIEETAFNGLVNEDGDGLS